MKILIVTQYFPPEMGAPQARLYELAGKLSLVLLGGELPFSQGSGAEQDQHTHQNEDPDRDCRDVSGESGHAETGRFAGAGDDERSLFDAPKEARHVPEEQIAARSEDSHPFALGDKHRLHGSQGGRAD